MGVENIKKQQIERRVRRHPLSSLRRVDAFHNFMNLLALRGQNLGKVAILRVNAESF